MTLTMTAGGTRGLSRRTARWRPQRRRPRPGSAHHPGLVLLRARRDGQRRHRGTERQGAAPACGGPVLAVRADRVHALPLRQRGRADHGAGRDRLRPTSAAPWPTATSAPRAATSIVASTADQAAGSVAFRMTPERWRTTGLRQARLAARSGSQPSIRRCAGVVQVGLERPYSPTQGAAHNWLARGGVAEVVWGPPRPAGRCAGTERRGMWVRGADPTRRGQRRRDGAVAAARAQPPAPFMSIHSRSGLRRRWLGTRRRGQAGRLTVARGPARPERRRPGPGWKLSSECEGRDAVSKTQIHSVPTTVAAKYDLAATEAERREMGRQARILAPRADLGALEQRPPGRPRWRRSSPRTESGSLSSCRDSPRPDGRVSVGVLSRGGGGDGRRSRVAPGQPA